MSELLNVSTIPLRVLREYFKLPGDATALEVVQEAAKRKNISPDRARRAFRRIYARRKILPPFARELYNETLAQERKHWLNGNDSE